MVPTFTYLIAEMIEPQLVKVERFAQKHGKNAKKKKK